MGQLGVFGSSDGVSVPYVTASSVHLKNPTCVRIDSSGQLYWAEAGNYVVRKWNRKTNIVTTVGGIMGVSGSTDAASGVATSLSHFSNPHDIWPDLLGNIYVVDSATYVVRKISATGIVSVLIGSYGVSGSTGNNGLAASALLSDKPYGVACDSSNNVYIADSDNGAIRMVNNIDNKVYLYAGTMIKTTTMPASPLDGYVATSTPMNFPGRPMVDMYDNLYLADVLYNNVRVVYSGDPSDDVTFAAEAAAICSLIAAFPTLMSSGGWFCPSVLVTNPWCINRYWLSSIHPNHTLHLSSSPSRTILDIIYSYSLYFHITSVSFSAHPVNIHRCYYAFNSSLSP